VKTIYKRHNWTQEKYLSSNGFISTCQHAALLVIEKYTTQTNWREHAGFREQSSDLAVYCSVAYINVLWSRPVDGFKLSLLLVLVLQYSVAVSMLEKSTFRSHSLDRNRCWQWEQVLAVRWQLQAERRVLWQVLAVTSRRPADAVSATARLDCAGKSARAESKFWWVRLWSLAMTVAALPCYVAHLPCKTLLRQSSQWVADNIKYQYENHMRQDDFIAINR